MEREQKNFLNDYLANVFNNIVLLEQEILEKTGFKNISIKEMHVLEAIFWAENKAMNNMKSVAEKLCISAGALSVSVNTLVKKGYVKRENDKNDRRIIRIYLTDEGKRLNKIHEKAHSDMIEKLGHELSDEQIRCLIASLITIKKYFYSEISPKKHKVSKIIEEEKSIWEGTAMK